MPNEGRERQQQIFSPIHVDEDFTLWSGKSPSIPAQFFWIGQTDDEKSDEKNGRG
jgi:hypothetical protein